MPAETAAGHAESLQQAQAFAADNPAGAACFLFVEVVPADREFSLVTAVHVRITDGARLHSITSPGAHFSGVWRKFVRRMTNRATKSSRRFVGGNEGGSKG